jgi:hypothetical protein
VVGINYGDLASAKKILEDYQVHTVISALSLQSEEHHNAQLGLIHAAAAASTVKRFTPSEFGFEFTQKSVSKSP